MSALLDAIGTFVGGGGLAATVGGVASAAIKLREKRIDYEHELAMEPHRAAEREHVSALHRQNAEHERHLADAALLIESERLYGEALTGSIDADASDTAAALSMSEQRWWVGAIRTLFRPFLTLVLWLAVFSIWAASSSPETSTLLAAAVSNAAMGTMAVWFGQRVVGSGAHR